MTLDRERETKKKFNIIAARECGLANKKSLLLKGEDVSFANPVRCQSLIYFISIDFLMD